VIGISDLLDYADPDLPLHAKFKIAHEHEFVTEEMFSVELVYGRYTRAHGTNCDFHRHGQVSYGVFRQILGYTKKP